MFPGASNFRINESNFTAANTVNNTVNNNNTYHYHQDNQVNQGEYSFGFLPGICDSDIF